MPCLRFLAPLALLVGCADSPRTRVDVEEEQAVREAWTELGAAFAAQNWDRYAELWIQEPDLRVIHPAQGSWLSGWTEFESVYRPLVATGSRWSIRENRIDIRVEPGGQTAWVVAEIEMRMLERAAILWQTAVLRKHQGDWRIVSFFSAPASAPTAGG